MLYNSFGMGDKKKIKERLSMPMSRLTQEVSKTTLNAKEKFLIFEAVVALEDTGNEVEIPQIRFRFRK
jgi:ubiquitin-activating enzyme E1